MPENLKIGAFVVGAILVLIALLGDNFKFFGAEIVATISNRLLRYNDARLLCQSVGE